MTIKVVDILSPIEETLHYNIDTRRVAATILRKLDRQLIKHPTCAPYDGVSIAISYLLLSIRCINARISLTSSITESFGAKEFQVMHIREAMLQSFRVLRIQLLACLAKCG